MSSTPVNPETTVAIASLVKMISLMGAELVVGRHRLDIDLFERSVRAKLFANVPGVSPEATAAGVAIAQSLIAPVLLDLRTRAEALAVQPTAPTPREDQLRLH